MITTLARVLYPSSSCSGVRRMFRWSCSNRWRTAIQPGAIDASALPNDGTGGASALPKAVPNRLVEAEGAEHGHRI